MIYSPFDSKVLEVNPDVVQRPSLLNEVPDDVWIFSVPFEKEWVAALLTEEEYLQMLEKQGMDKELGESRVN